MVRRRKKLVVDSRMATILAWPQMTVLGIDPSMASTGWAVVQFVPKWLPSVIAHGTLTTQPSDLNMKNVMQRSRIIFDKMQAVSSIYVVDRCAIELPAPVTRESRGVASQSGSMIATAVYNAVGMEPERISMYSPNSVKKIVTLNGKSSKAQVKAAVIEWTSFGKRFNADVSDAIAVAITCALDHLSDQPTWEEVDAL